MSLYTIKYKIHKGQKKSWDRQHRAAFKTPNAQSQKKYYNTSIKSGNTIVQYQRFYLYFKFGVFETILNENV